MVCTNHTFPVTEFMYMHVKEDVKQGSSSTLPQCNAKLIFLFSVQVPSARPQSKGKKAARGVPTKYASGGYTQTHGVISSSDLAMLKENKW